MVKGPGFAVLLLTDVCFAIDRNHAVNITIYHVTEANYSLLGVSNRDTGDALGDIYFDGRSKCKPIECAESSKQHDCTNPEVAGANLTVTEVQIEVDTSKWGVYSRCNLEKGDSNYTCTKSNSSVGKEDVAGYFGAPTKAPGGKRGSADYTYWKFNLAKKVGGMWYSTLKADECELGSDPYSGNCQWREVKRLKRVQKSCLDKALEKVIVAASDHFNACSPADAKNTSSSCYIHAWYDTILGKGSNNTIWDPSTDTGMPIASIKKAWETAFTSGDVADGGCPVF
jgi:hypothetical protein